MTIDNLDEKVEVFANRMTKEQTVTKESGTTFEVHEEGDLPAEDLIEELLVEEISIDGMCGVY